MRAARNDDRTMAGLSVTNPDQDGGSRRISDPSPVVWKQLGLTPVYEIHAGHQSRVFLASAGTGQLIVKMFGDGHNPALVRQRAGLVHRLAEINAAVVGPVGLAADFVADVESWQAVCYPYVDGRAPSSEDRVDVEAMAETLASLHESMSALSGADLPPVAALKGTDDTWLSPGRLIHGDFADTNVIITSSGPRIIDFDDCGQGSVEFEVGNSLYMTLFDSWKLGDLDRYRRFRSWFTDRYQQAASRTVDEAAVDDAVEVRFSALQRWLSRPAEAPIGIRSAPAAWRARLHAFAGDQGLRAATSGE